MNLEILKSYGIDYEDGIARCMNDRDFYESLLEYFMKDTAYARSSDAFQRKSYNEMFEALHELKGVCGNIAMTKLYKAICPLVELLRKKSNDEPTISKMFEQVTCEYNLVVKGLELAVKD